MSPTVLDSFALVAYFRDEPGAAMVENLLLKAGREGFLLQMTDVNYAEVKYSILKRDGAAAWDRAAPILHGLPIEFHSTTRMLADSAAGFKARFKLSLANAFAAALAQANDADLVTGDLEFRALRKEIRVSWVKR